MTGNSKISGVMDLEKRQKFLPSVFGDADHLAMFF